MINNYSAVILNTCDAWEAYESFRLIGIYTSKLQLKIIIHKLLESNTIELTDNYTVEDLDFDDVETLRNQLKYISMNLVNFNENE